MCNVWSVPLWASQVSPEAAGCWGSPESWTGWGWLVNSPTACPMSPRLAFGHQTHGHDQSRPWLVTDGCQRAAGTSSPVNMFSLLEKWSIVFPFGNDLMTVKWGANPIISDTLQTISVDSLTRLGICMFVWEHISLCFSQSLEAMVASKTMQRRYCLAFEPLTPSMAVLILTFRALQRVSGSRMPVISLSWLISISLCWENWLG